MHPDKAKSMKSWEKLFNPYGIYEFAGDHSGVDIEPLRELKIPASGLVKQIHKDILTFIILQKTLSRK